MDALKELTDKVYAFSEERDWHQFHTPENLAKSIAIEAGELLECYQWNSQPDPESVAEELADVLNYCLLLARTLGLDPVEIIEKKLAVNAAKYPVDKCKGKSTKYDKL